MLRRVKSLFAKWQLSNWERSRVCVIPASSALSSHTLMCYSLTVCKFTFFRGSFDILRCRAVASLWALSTRVMHFPAALFSAWDPNWVLMSANALMWAFESALKVKIPIDDSWPLQRSGLTARDLLWNPPNALKPTLARKLTNTPTLSQSLAHHIARKNTCQTYRRYKKHVAEVCSFSENKLCHNNRSAQIKNNVNLVLPS